MKKRIVEISIGGVGDRLYGARIVKSEPDRFLNLKIHAVIDGLYDCWESGYHICGDYFREACIGNESCLYVYSDLHLEIASLLKFNRHVMSVSGIKPFLGRMIEGVGYCAIDIYNGAEFKIMDWFHITPCTLCQAIEYVAKGGNNMGLYTDGDSLFVRMFCSTYDFYYNKFTITDVGKFNTLISKIMMMG